MISNKLFGLVAIVGLAGAMGFSAVGCSDSSSGDDDGDTDGGASSSSSSGSSSGRPQQDGGASSSSGSPEPESCIQSTFYAFQGIGPVAGQEKCNDSQISEWLNKCLGDTADQAACEAFYSATATGACGLCLSPYFGPEGTDLKTLPSGAITLVSTTSVTVNVSGCIATLAEGASAECKANTENQASCAQGACSLCEQEEFTACIDEAFGDDFCPAEFPTDAACTAAMEAIPDAAAAAACGSGNDFEARFLAVAKHLCGGGGTGPVDGGADSGN